MKASVLTLPLIGAIAMMQLCSLAVPLGASAQVEQGPGLVQYWYDGPATDRFGVEDFVDTADPIVDPFRAGHGTSWWFGHQIEGEGQLPDLDDCAADGLCPPYPLEISEFLGDDTNLPVDGGTQSHNNYTVRATGFIKIPESGTYRFADGIDDYTFLAIDADKSGVAGDTDDEVIIDDNNWTDVDRDRGTLDGSVGEIDLDVAAGGDWFAIEFYMSEAGGHDAGIIYWDYDTDNNVVGGAEGFPEFDVDPIDAVDVASLWIPNEYLAGPDKPADGGGGTPLEAGDANINIEFNQLDLVQVRISAKYLSGQDATWGEGDWNGAPGGSPGNPPAGDNRFDQVDIIAALTAGKYLTGPYGAIGMGGVAGDGQTSITYNPGNGEVGVDAPAGVELTSVNIDSAAGIFTGAAAENLGGSFDNDADNNIFKATFGSSFGSLSFGNVAQAGLSEDVVAGDLTVVGSLAGGGDLGAVDLIYIPEPSSLALLGLAFAGAVILWMRRRA